MEHVFLFGTLKEGFPNFSINKGERVEGDFLTKECFPLYLVSNYHIPWLIDSPGKGHQVRGQLFEVDTNALAAMDELERVGRPEGYTRKRIEVVSESNGVIRNVFVYCIPPNRLEDIAIKVGPLQEYEIQHADLFRLPVEK